jgi:hypothetical protein
MTRQTVETALARRRRRSRGGTDAGGLCCEPRAIPSQGRVYSKVHIHSRQLSIAPHPLCPVNRHCSHPQPRQPSRCVRVLHPRIASGTRSLATHAKRIVALAPIRCLNRPLKAPTLATWQPVLALPHVVAQATARRANVRVQTWVALLSHPTRHTMKAPVARRQHGPWTRHRHASPCRPLRSLNGRRGIRLTAETPEVLLHTVDADPRPPLRSF